ncbi:MAG: sulfatase [bacterium]
MLRVPGATPAPLRQRLLSVCVVALLLVLTAVHGAFADEESTRPNILVLVADDAGWDDSTAYGNPRIRTPNIQRLADSGLTFTHAFVTSPQCSPSRASMLTGLYPHQTGAENLHDPIPADTTILPTYLREEGYYTGNMLKQHIGRAAARQFDWYSPRLGRFERFLDAADGRPFFLWVGFMDPHRPYHDRAIPEPHDPADVRVPAHLADTPQTRREIARYYDEISRMDGWIGNYLDALEARGMRENTLVIYLSDNGPPFPRAKGSLYDAGTRTPYVWSRPGTIEEGGRYEGLASTLDLAPTLIDIAGGDVPDHMEGSSIKPILRSVTGASSPAAETGEAADTGDAPGGTRSAVFSQRNWHGTDDHMRAVRTGNYKLIINAYDASPFGLPPDVSQSDTWRSLLNLRAEGRLSPIQRLNFAVPRPPVEFYDLRRDPHEYTNRAWDPEYAEQQERLFRELEAWMARTGDYPPGPEPEGDAVDRVTGRPRDWRHRLLLWSERYLAPWLLPLVEARP